MTRDDLQSFEAAGEELIRLGNSTLGLRVLVTVLKLREEMTPAFRCHIDESAGMAEVVELNSYSKRVPCA